MSFWRNSFIKSQKKKNREILSLCRSCEYSECRFQKPRNLVNEAETGDIQPQLWLAKVFCHWSVWWFHPAVSLPLQWCHWIQRLSEDSALFWLRINLLQIAAAADAAVFDTRPAVSVRNLWSRVSHTDSLGGVQRHFSDRCRLCAVTETQCDITIHLEGKRPIGWFWRSEHFTFSTSMRSTWFPAKFTVLINQSIHIYMLSGLVTIIVSQRLILTTANIWIRNLELLFVMMWNVDDPCSHWARKQCF